MSAELSRDEVKSLLREMIIRELRLDGVTPEEVGDDLPLTGARLGFDSIDILELLVAVERRFGVRIGEEDTARGVLESVNSLADFVISKSPPQR